MGLHVRHVLRRIPGARRLAHALGLSHHTTDFPQGGEVIAELGHRTYVGGKWEELGRLQFNFLREQGLQPRHYLLDIACGSLRAGIHFIPYLQPGHYLGVEKEQALISAGIEQELGRDVYDEKRPVILCSADFEFERFGIKPDYALAQSLFTHLPSEHVNRCLKKLRAVMGENGVFFATFLETERPVENPPAPHDRLRFLYTRAEMEAFGSRNGWRPSYIGDWQHPRKQMMVKYVPA